MGSYRYLVLQQWPACGVAPAFELQLPSLRLEQPVHGGGTDAAELCRDSLLDTELRLCFHDLHVRTQKDYQSFPGLIIK